MNVKLHQSVILGEYKNIFQEKIAKNWEKGFMMKPDSLCVAVSPFTGDLLYSIIMEKEEII